MLLITLKNLTNVQLLITVTDKNATNPSNNNVFNFIIRFYDIAALYKGHFYYIFTTLFGCYDEIIFLKLSYNYYCLYQSKHWHLPYSASDKWRFLLPFPTPSRLFALNLFSWDSAISARSSASSSSCCTFRNLARWMLVCSSCASQKTTYDGKGLLHASSTHSNHLFLLTASSH